MTPFHSEVFEFKGRHFTLQLYTDDDAGAPWKLSDRHGPVSDWVRRGKHPGERVITKDGGYCFYDYAAAIEVAKRDKWGVSQEEKDAFAKLHGRGMTCGEIAAAAVDHDLEYLRAWVRDEWFYVLVEVFLSDAAGTRLGDSDFIGGVEYGLPGEYWREVSDDLAEEITHDLEKAAHEVRVASRFRDAMECGL